MELILLGLGKLLSSAGFGTVFGGVMGYFNRKADLQYKKLEYEDHDKQRSHELAQRKIDSEIIEKEYAGKVRVAQIEGESQSEAQAYSALSKSYEFAQPENGSKMAAFSSFVRPFISLAYFLISTLGAGYILLYAFKTVKVQFSVDQWYELTEFILSWVVFMASTTIGWWFGMRAGKHPQGLK